MPSTTMDPELRDRMKSAVWYTVGKIVDEACATLGVDATPQYITALTELVYAQAVTLSSDVESFAWHAKRKTVNTDDVLMLCRRNEGLKDVLEEFVGDLEQKKFEAKSARTGNAGHN
ncbi:kinetochore component CENP-S-domain-containing protein [Kockiozyma suomiensis]|uniref:kinetochore component CENP-S-domain-containing protein n=1 Tax=Kockiozyma suomiensis TaxID=1337062 RepID=UPI003343F9ED